MKITKSTLKQLIKEELESAMQENVDREEVEALTNDINTALQELASGDFESAHETLRDVVDDLADLANITNIDTENPHYKQSAAGYR
jgi:Zn-dependent M16 (insulinase) family peptidase